MEPIKAFTGKTVALPINDTDTDQIIPARYLKVTDKVGLGEGLFADWRRLNDGTLNPDFPLNRDDAAGAQVLIAGHNFGCGSSREHAVWALREYGFRAILATSFADIFYANCCENGVLAVRLPEPAMAQLFERHAATPGYSLTVDLVTPSIDDKRGFQVPFTIAPYHRELLLQGLDPISRDAIWRYVAELNTAKGVTFFLTTQYLEEADRLAHDVAIMDAGKIVAQGSPEALKASIGTDVVTLKIEGGADELARAEHAVRRFEGIEEVRAVNGSVVCYVRDGSAAIAGLVLLLNEEGIRASEVTLARPTLDDVFLRKTGHHMEADTQPDGVPGPRGKS